MIQDCDRIIHVMCDPNIKTELGIGPTYEKFITYIRSFLAPYMKMKFVEEEYFKPLYEEKWANQRTVDQLPRGHSKAQPLYSKLLTPNGWVRMGDIKPGDYVFSMDGKPAKVLSIHPQGIKKNFLITTRDKRTMECNDEHICVVQCPSNTGKKIIFKPLKEIIKNYRVERYDKRNGKHYNEYKYFIPTIKPIDFQQKELPIDPYTLGFWLGDGHQKGAVISTADLEVLNYFPYKITKYSTKYEYGLIGGLNKSLRINGLSKKGIKHIPEIYLRSSIAQRVRLLQGLMDSDGYVQVDGKRAGFTTIKERLRDDFVSLVRSLGGTATVSIQYTRFDKDSEYKKSYNITVRFPKEVIPFRLKRKRIKWKGSIKTKAAIVSIKEIEKTEMQCIKVERETYITNNYLPTHNTELIGIWMTIYIADYQPFNPFYEKRHGIKKKITEQILIAGASDDLNAWVLRIKDFFDVVPILARLKPLGAKKDAVTKRWNSKELILRNASQIHLRTVKGRIRGTHNDRVCADDLITESSSLTDRQTIDVWDGAVDGTTTAKEAMINVIGTPLRYTDIQFHLKNKPVGYYFKARPAIIDEDKQIVLAPNRMPYSLLMEKKAIIGSTKFSAEYMLNPIDDETSLIKREHILGCCDRYFEGIWLRPSITDIGGQSDIKLIRLNNEPFRREDWDAIFITADFAFSDRVTADHSVFSYYGTKRDKIYKIGYVRNPSGEGWSPMTQMNILKELYVYFTGTMLGLEENSIKGVVKDIRDLNLPITLYWMAGSDKAEARKGDVDFVSKRHTIGKVNSIQRLDATYENKKMVLPYKTEMDIDHMDRQIEESISWALDEGKLIEIGKHPDIPITDIIMNEMSEKHGVYTDMAVIGGSAEDDTEDNRKIVKTQRIKGE